MLTYFFLHTCFNEMREVNNMNPFQKSTDRRPPKQLIAGPRFRRSSRCSGACRPQPDLGPTGADGHLQGAPGGSKVHRHRRSAPNQFYSHSLALSWQNCKTQGIFRKNSRFCQLQLVMVAEKRQKKCLDKVNIRNRVKDQTWSPQCPVVRRVRC